MSNFFSCSVLMIFTLFSFSLLPSLCEFNGFGIVSSQFNNSATNDKEAISESFFEFEQDVLPGSKSKDTKIQSHLLYYELPKHDIISFTLSFWIPDEVASLRKFQIMLDDQPLPNQTLTIFYHALEDEYFQPKLSYLSKMTVAGRILHSDKKLQMTIILPASMQKVIDFESITLLLSNQSKDGFDKNINPIFSESTICFEGQYQDPTGFCTSAHSSCKFAFGPSAKECYSCAQGYYFDGSQCQKCEIDVEQCSEFKKDSFLKHKSPNFIKIDFKTNIGSQKFITDIDREAKDLKQNINSFSFSTRNLDSNSEKSSMSPSKFSNTDRFASFLFETSNINEKSLALLFSVITIISNILHPGNPLPLLLILFSKMPQYVDLIEIKFLYFGDQIKSQNWTLMQIPINFGPKMADNWKLKFTDYTLPQMFNQQYHSSYLVNNWENLSSLTLLILTVWLIFLFECLFSKFKIVQHWIFKKAKSALKWNLLVLLFISNLDNLTLFSCFEFSTLQTENTFNIISFVGCVATIGLVLAIMWIFLKVTNYSFKNKNSSDSPLHSQKLESYQIFYEGYKANTLANKRFLLIFLLRIILLNITIALLNDDPIVQFVIITVLSAMMIFHLLLQRPFVQKIHQTSVVIIEIILFFMNFSSLLVALLQNGILVGSPSFKKNLEYIPLICLCLLTFIFKILIILAFGQAIKTVYNFYQSRTDEKNNFAAEFSPSKLRHRHQKFNSLNIESPGGSFQPENEELQEQVGLHSKDQLNKPWKKLRIIGGIDIGDSPLKLPQPKQEEKIQYSKCIQEKKKEAANLRRTPKEDFNQESSDMPSYELRDVSEKFEKTPDSHSDMHPRSNVPRFGNINKYQKFSLDNSEAFAV